MGGFDPPAPHAGASSPRGATRDNPPTASTATATATATGPFVLRTLLDDVPLSEDGENEGIKINCVEYLDGNLYIGTSASELLHFVQIPPDPADNNGQPVFILASRLQPTYAESSVAGGGVKPGVQQILLLTKVQKACILCNNTVTFYSLPELSPVFGTVRVKNCYWIGGLDLNLQAEAAEDREGSGGGHQRSHGETIMLSLARKIQVVRVGEDARVVKQIDFSGSTISVRRDSIACVADSRNYALLDVDRQLKIPLMAISSLDDSQPDIGQAQNIAGNSHVGILRSSSSAQTRTMTSDHAGGHGRSTSLGGFMSHTMRRHTGSNNNNSSNHPGDGNDQASQGIDSPQRTGTPDAQQPGQDSDPTDKALPSLPPDPDAAKQAKAPKATPVMLKPHIVSPTPDEFLLVTGTGPQDPGIGMFVNLDGDPTRPTLEFDKYPREIVVDGGLSDPGSSRMSMGEEEEGYVLASLTREFEDGLHAGLEVQRWDWNMAEGEPEKFWLEAPTRPVSSSDDAGDTSDPPTLGIRSLVGSQDSDLQQVVEKLCQRRFSPFSISQADAAASSRKSTDSRTAHSLERLNNERELFEREEDDSPLPDDWEALRNDEEEQFARRFARTTSRLAVWSGNRLWWAVRNPLLLQLDSSIAATAMEGHAPPHTAIERRQLFSVLAAVRGREPRTELEFMTFTYIKQRASVLLFASFLHSKDPAFPPEMRAMEEVLLDSNLDPRVVLGLIPGLRNEILEPKRGIWIPGGVKETVERYMASEQFGQIGSTVQHLQETTLLFIKSYLWSARRKKGLASSGSEGEVFRTVDAALLIVLLELDKDSAPGFGKSGSIRSELYELVDHGVDCFDRAVDLLESYHRLYILSRLHQSRKATTDVLSTWKRIIEGEQDIGGEFGNGELRIREYLSKISDQAVVQDYGLWLANRNPKLGVQVFADDKGRARTFEPAQVVVLLRKEAPDAVKYYLEHLVFGKGHTTYVNELITYYLDIVITHLASSAAARETMAGTYEAYRALKPPKPTYRQFLTDNAPPDDEVWQSRLRLLQLLGETHEYDTKAIRARISEAFAFDDDNNNDGETDSAAATTTEPEPEPTRHQLLVPETIILDGREHRHIEALRLLVHRLGDYDTAVSYCLRGGASIYTPYPGTTHTSSDSPTTNSDAHTHTHPPRRASMPPTEDTQRHLFGALLREFLAIDDVSDRVQHVGALLERFGAWFDLADVLRQIPDAWSVDVIAGFLVTSLRRLVSERRETDVASRLSSAENLGVNWEWVEKVEEHGPTIETGG
ncbi:hypothetical protein BD289DRAFT_503852 [Coniella lustricola]|uniref:CNH domain-containing protein n=1 Tax=Coniella lustricola TaxID=2025994 RepID=A0A2T3AFZ5_9PEZI|nr:hypothetical protein BD289DRAFT_503852 [Coniella lustricola]